MILSSSSRQQTAQDLPANESNAPQESSNELERLFGLEKLCDEDRRLVLLLAEALSFNPTRLSKDLAAELSLTRA
jgi:hypothetical protein